MGTLRKIRGTPPISPPANTLLALGAAYLAWDYYRSQVRARTDARERFYLVSNTVKEIESALCEGDMGFDEMQTHLNYGLDFDAINLALDSLGQDTKHRFSNSSEASNSIPNLQIDKSPELYSFEVKISSLSNRQDYQKVGRKN